MSLGLGTKIIRNSALSGGGDPLSSGNDSGSVSGTGTYSVRVRYRYEGNITAPATIKIRESDNTVLRTITLPTSSASMLYDAAEKWENLPFSGESLVSGKRFHDLGVPFAMATADNYLIEAPTGGGILFLDEAPDFYQLSTGGIVDAVVNHSADNTGATDTATELQAALDAAVAGGDVLYIPDGDYTVGSKLEAFSLTSDLVVCFGQAAKLLHTGGNSALQIQAEKRAGPFSLGSDLARGVTTVTLNDTTGIVAGDTIKIESDEIAETGWNTEAADSCRVVSVDSGTDITIERNTNFDYDISLEVVTVEVHARPLLTLRNVNIEINSDTHGAATNLLSLRGMQVDSVGLTLADVGSNTRGGPDGCSTSISSGGNFKQNHLTGLRYAILVNFQNDLQVTDTYSTLCRHAVSTASWSSNVTVTRSRGQADTSTMDSHPAFNVEYNGVISNDQEYPNNRATGSSVINAVFTKNAVYDTTYCRMCGPTGSQQNTTRYPYLRGQHDVLLRNVTYTENTGRFSGACLLNQAKSVTIDGCDLSAIAVDSGTVDGNTITNTTFGIVRNRDSNGTTITNCTADLSRQPAALNMDFAIWVGGAAGVQDVITNLTVINTKPTDSLIGATGTNTDILFIGCSLIGFFNMCENASVNPTLAFVDCVMGIDSEFFPNTVTGPYELEEADFTNCTGSVGSLTF